jgi:hypothetical protein
MNVTGKPAGIYEFIFVSTSNDGFCGMAAGEQSVVRVYLVPQPVGFPVLTNVCPGTTEAINFNDFIPPEMRYFINEMGWTVTWLTPDGSKEVSMPVTAGLNNVGNNAYRYVINDSEGKFRGKYAEMRESAYRCPEDSGYVTHTVRIRENEDYAIPNRSISFCTDILSLVNETKYVLNTNLFGYLGSSAPGGRWSIQYKGNISDIDFPPIDENSGDVGIPIAMLTALGIDSVVFKYSYSDCSQRDTFTFLTFIFNPETFKNTFTETELDVCRNLMSGVVELSSIFGFTAPLTSGIWFQETNGLYEEMLYGKVDISEMQTGSLYRFRYDVNSAVDAICMVEGTSTQFGLRVYDLSVSGAEARICKRQFAEGVSVNLSRYVPGLNDTARISRDRITWKDGSGAVISNPDSYQLKSTEEWQTSDTSNYRMQFQYEVRSNCGLYSGSLQISAVDSLSNDTVRRIVVCYTDDYAKHIDLYQVLGMVGATGRFIHCGELNKDFSVVESTGIMNASALFDSSKDSEVYEFCYLPGRDDSCVSGKTSVTITVTKNVKEDSEFKKL